MSAAPIVKDITLRCTPEHAFKVFTEQADLWWPRGHRKFEGSTLEQSARVGGQVIERAPDGQIFVLADILEMRAPHELRMAWHPGKGDAPSEVHVTFRATEGGTAMRVEHGEGSKAFGDLWGERAVLFRKGWSIILPALQNLIENERGGDRG